LALEQYIQRIDDKLHLLLKKLQQVQAENVLLKEQLQSQESTLVTQQETIAALENKLHLAKIAGATQGTTSSRDVDEEFRKEMRNKINDYIKEIDRCIALLNS
jgi:predicted  nucleic acid-binding Zn-ribbon protein